MEAGDYSDPEQTEREANTDSRTRAALIALAIGLGVALALIVADPPTERMPRQRRWPRPGRSAS